MLNYILLDAAPQGDGGMTIIMMVALIAIFYFFMIRPQQKKQKKIREEREKLQKGSKVITAGGIYGRVKDVRENTFIVEIDKGVMVTVDKNCVYPDNNPEEAIKDAQEKAANR